MPFSFTNILNLGLHDTGWEALPFLVGRPWTRYFSKFQCPHHWKRKSSTCILMCLGEPRRTIILTSKNVLSINDLGIILVLHLFEELSTYNAQHSVLTTAVTTSLEVGVVKLWKPRAPAKESESHGELGFEPHHCDAKACDLVSHVMQPVTMVLCPPVLQSDISLLCTKPAFVSLQGISFLWNTCPRRCVWCNPPLLPGVSQP